MSVQRYRRGTHVFELRPIETATSIELVTTLDDAVAEELANGGRLKSRGGTGAVVAYGAGNVLLHITFAVLTLIVNGFFVFPWIVWANTNRQRRVTLHVAPDGRVTRTR
ncbi:MAG: hypothetical protein QOD39_242 [Mycobacterium sp.]|nr:hypothetical protein [Mycobacterium sp.]